MLKVKSLPTTARGPLNVSALAHCTTCTTHRTNGLGCSQFFTDWLSLLTSIKQCQYKRHHQSTRCDNVILYAVLQDCNMMICNKHEKHQIQTSVIRTELWPNTIWLLDLPVQWHDHTTLITRQLPIRYLCNFVVNVNFMEINIIMQVHNRCELARSF